MAARKSTKSGNATTKVTTVAQASAVKLSKATEGLAKIMTELNSTTESYSELVTNVELKQAELDLLNSEYAEKVREMEADLKIKQKESEEVLVKSILNTRGEVSVSVNEWNSLKNELQTLKADFNDAVQAETNKTVAIVISKHKSELENKELLFKADSAGMQAKLETAKDKLETLNNQIEDYKTQITSDREARVMEAQARGGQNIVVQPDGRK